MSRRDPGDRAGRRRRRRDRRRTLRRGDARDAEPGAADPRRPPRLRRRSVDRVEAPRRDVEDQAVDRHPQEATGGRAGRATCSRTLASRSANAPNTRSVALAASSSASRPRMTRLVGPVEAAPGVGDDDDLVGAEELLADDERADRVVGREAAGVADDVGVAGPQAERLLDVEPGVHAGDDREPGQRRGGQRRAVERLGVALVLREEPLVLDRRIAGPLDGQALADVPPAPPYRSMISPIVSWP